MQRTIDHSLRQVVFDAQFTGVLIIDAQKGDTIYQNNSQKYFTPASNTKIFTLFAGLKLLPDSIPSLRYLESQDTLFIKGTGDPAVLHPYFKDSTLLNFLEGYPYVALYSSQLEDTHWAPGWAWEDFDGAYAPERSALPLYGNVLEAIQGSSLEVTPDYFRDSIKTLRYTYRRDRERNLFYVDIARGDTVYIPFRADSSLSRKLLERATGKKIHHSSHFPKGSDKTLYGQPTDSLYKRMMQESDNFLAEQLLIVASGSLSDTLSSSMARKHILETYLKELRAAPVWVDGSGLSRYNLFTPESMVYVLHQIYQEIPRDRLFTLFPAGGVSGTLKDWYAGANGKPYVFAKTGTLANNHCLSGYLVTRSGKTLIFSFMNNHFTQPAAELKTEMQRIFEVLREQY